MEVTGTKKAFETLLSERGVYTKLGVTRGTVSNWKQALEGHTERNMPTIDLMEKMLQIAGARVVKEKVWQLP